MRRAVGAWVVGFALAGGIAGCVMPKDDTKSTTPAPALVYRTGSNIPVKDTSPPMTPEEREQQLEQIRSLQRTGSPGKASGG